MLPGSFVFFLRGKAGLGRWTGLGLAHTHMKNVSLWYGHYLIQKFFFLVSLCEHVFTEQHFLIYSAEGRFEKQSVPAPTSSSNTHELSSQISILAVKSKLYVATFCSTFWGHMYILCVNVCPHFMLTYSQGLLQLPESESFYLRQREETEKFYLKWMLPHFNDLEQLWTLALLF